MSGSASVATGSGVGDGYRPPFTAVQWQELVHQALIYKYLLAGLPVPSDLVVPIRKSLEALSARFFHHPTLRYCSYYGKKFDPEPGRCRRTDGKKWRCSKDAYPNSKYCERHMHRGRNRSRKPVESQSSSQSLLPAMSHITTASSTGYGNGSYQSVSSGTFPSPSLYPISNSESFDFRSSVSKLQVDGSPYGINNKDLRHKQGLTINVEDQSHSNLDGTWPLMPMKVPTGYMSEPANDSYIESNSTQPGIAYAFESMIDAASAALSKQSSSIASSAARAAHQYK